MVRAGDDDERLSILPFSDALFDVLLASVPEGERRSSMHVVRPNGTVTSAGAAVIELLALSPATRWRARRARVWPPLRRQIERDYRRLAERRAELADRVPDTPPTIVPPRWVRF